MLVIYKNYTEMHVQQNVKFIGYTIYYRNVNTLFNVQCGYKHTYSKSEGLRIPQLCGRQNRFHELKIAFIITSVKLILSEIQQHRFGIKKSKINKFAGKI
jgi:hypothetical protein